jgi:predicted phosphoribosyltransferase
MSKELNLPFTIFFVKKIPSPFNKELAIGAVSENGFLYKNYDIMGMLGVNSGYIENSAKLILSKIEEKKELYKAPIIELKSKRIILVDDGIATGATSLLAAISLKKQKNVREVIITSPIASSDSLKMMQCIADKIEVLLKPKNFRAVGAYYQRFHQLSDREVIELLH